MNANNRRCPISEIQQQTALSSDRAIRGALLVTTYLLLLMVCGGATCARSRSTLAEFNPPPVFTQGTPDLPTLIQQTNRSLAINSLASNSLTISSPEIPYKLNGNFRWERPHNFRLETKLFSSAMGTPLAAGSNANMFWMQTSRPQPSIYFARHDQFENQMGPRQFLPISPLWLREAMGIIELDPQGQHEGPITRSDGNLEVVSLIPSPRGAYRRVIVLDSVNGTISQTRLYDQNQKMIAIANMRNHEYYSGINWSLPHQVQIQLVPDMGDEISFTVDVNHFQTNQASPPNAYNFPDTTGMTTVDLVRLNAGYAGQNGNGQIVQPIAFAHYQSPEANLPSTAQPNPTMAGSTTATPSTGSQSGITNPIYRSAASIPDSQGWQQSIRH